MLHTIFVRLGVAAFLGAGLSYAIGTRATRDMVVAALTVLGHRDVSRLPPVGLYGIVLAIAGLTA